MKGRPPLSHWCSSFSTSNSAWNTESMMANFCPAVLGKQTYASRNDCGGVSRTRRVFLRDNSAGVAKSGLGLENPGTKWCNDINMELAGIRNFSEWRIWSRENWRWKDVGGWYWKGRAKNLHSGQSDGTPTQSSRHRNGYLTSFSLQWLSHSFRTASPSLFEAGGHLAFAGENTKARDWESGDTQLVSHGHRWELRS